MHQFSFNYKVDKKYMLLKQEVWIIVNCVGGYKNGEVSIVIYHYSFTWMSDICGLKIDTMSELVKDIRIEAEKFYLKTFINGE